MKWALVACLPVLIFAGCGRQGPGERCDTANGSNDCEDGLVCISKETLRGTASLCCPTGTGPESIVPGCTYGAVGPVTDAGTQQTGDAASDAPDADAASDAAQSGQDAGTDGATIDVASSPEAGGDSAADADAGAPPDGAADASAETGTDAAADGAPATQDAGASDGSADAAG